MKLNIVSLKFISVFIALFLCACFLTKAQEKVTLNSDRDIYVVGERVWLNLGAYLNDSNTPTKISSVLYVELLNKANNPIVQIKCKTDQSIAQTQFVLPDTLSTGNYVLRAYTRWMQNSSPDQFAKKTISIINPFGGNDFPVGDKRFTSDTIMVFPEGGNLVSGSENKMLICSYDSYGIGKSVRGKLRNDQNDIVNFETNKVGYGVVDFVPEIDKSYEIVFNDVSIEVPPVSGEQFLVQLINENEQVFSFKIRNDHNNDHNNDHKLAIYGKDGKFLREFTIPFNGIVDIVKSELNYGILSALLVDKTNEVLAHRTFVNRNIENPGKFKIHTTKKTYKLRERVDLNLNSSASLNNISVSVVKSCLLDQNQKRSIFLSENDLLLSYPAPSFITSGVKRKKLLPEVEGELLTGKITNIQNGEPIENKKFMLNVVSKSPIIKIVRTDSNGDFRFLINRYGKEEIVIQPYSKDTTLFSYKVEVNDPYCLNYGENRWESFIMDPLRAKRVNDAIVNMQINTVYSNCREEEAMAVAVEEEDSFYGKPEVSVPIDKFIELPSIEEAISEIVPFVWLKRSKNEYKFDTFEAPSYIKRRGETLTLVDGIPIRDIKGILDINLHDIESIEVVNLNYFMESERLGFLLAFYTKDRDLGGMEFDNRIFRQVHQGYVNQYKYVSPDYSDENAKNSTLADFRNLLYFNVFEEIEVSKPLHFSFYTCDEETEYTIVVKGINENGEFVEERKNFTVSK